MSTRMTVSTAEVVAKGAINAIYSQKIESAEKEMRTLGDAVYNALFTETQHNILTEYPYMFEKAKQLDIRAGDNRFTVDLTRRMPILPYMYYSFNLLDEHINKIGVYIGVDGEEHIAQVLEDPSINTEIDGEYCEYSPLVCKRLYEYSLKKQVYNRIIAERAATYNDIIQRLCSYSTVKRAYDNWPEIRQFLPSVKNPDKVTTCSTTDKLLREVQNGRKDQNQQKG